MLSKEESSDPGTAVSKVASRNGMHDVIRSDCPVKGRQQQETDNPELGTTTRPACSESGDSDQPPDTAITTSLQLSWVKANWKV